ncbi:hypothetical protein ABIF63_007801 [Bradyrhizobium japonicum]|uniref:Uncharacterized protein n=2 Tax=Nitrobacteraceae TaxID=41294 RepID=A0ABV2S3D1_BRAJP
MRCCAPALRGTRQWCSSHARCPRGLGTYRGALSVGAATCPDSGANQKSPAEGQTDAIDPERTLGRMFASSSFAGLRYTWRASVISLWGRPSKWDYAMPKRSSIGKRRSKVLPTLGLVGMSLSMASGACASTSEVPANTPPPSPKHEIFLGEEEISDVSLATFYVFDREDAGPPPLFQKLRLAAGCGAGCGCSFGCAYWPQPPQPPKATQPTQHRKKKPPHRTN